jgi:general nucleoside transport system permease protein
MNSGCEGADGRPVYITSFAVGLGETGSTPHGLFRVGVKLENPGWTNPRTGELMEAGTREQILTRAEFAPVLERFETVPLGLSQHVVGIGITLLATSLTYFTYRIVLPEVTSPPRIASFQPLPIPLLSDIPVLGPALFAQTPMTYLAFATVGVVAWVLYRTPLGLAVRAAGENPAAVEAQGISVTAIRMGAVMVGSALMAVGGAFLTMSAFNSFFFEMINGRGWICIALVVFGSWRPGKAMLGAILFAAFDAYQVRLQQITGGAVPYQLFLMMPFVLSILALIVMSRRAAYPKALMVPYQKGER